MVSKSRDDTIALLGSMESSLQEEFELGLEESRDIDRVFNSIKIVKEAKRKIEANGNRRLVLESLYLDLTR